MKPSPDLFQLIRSLSKTEKRYFKIYASRHVIGEENVYVKLFDAVAAQEIYDEKAVIGKFKKEPFIKHIAVRKNYLYHMILDALHAYHAGSSIESRLNRLLHHAEILYMRALYKHCDKVVQSIVKIAGQYQYYDYVSRALIYRRNMIVEKNMPATDVDLLLEQITGQMETCDRLALNQRTYNNLSYHLIIMSKKEGEKVRSATSSDWVRQQLRLKLLADEKSPLSDWARQLYYNCRALLYMMLGNWNEAYKASRAMIAVFEKNKNLIERSPQSYTVALSNGCPVLLKLKKFDEYGGNLQKLKHAPVKTHMEEARRFYRYYNNTLILYINTGEFGKGIQLVPEIEKGLTEFRDGINPLRELSFCYNLFYVFFGAGQYKKALAWLNRILNYKVMDLRRDLMCFARILNLVVHYELGNDLLLEHTVRSTYQFLRNKERAYRFELILLTFIRKKIPGITNKTDLHAAFRDTRKQILQLSKDPYEKKALEYFDFIAWIDSKLENKSFREIVQRDYRTRPYVIYHE